MSYSVKDILNMAVAPALGCTEPTAVALCSAAAADLLPRGDLERIELWVDPNIYKNGVAVSIPGAAGATGIDLAAALGAFGGDPKRKLEVLEPITDQTLAQARAFVAENRVCIHILQDRSGIDIRARLFQKDHTAEARIRNMHDNIVVLLLDDQPLDDHPLLTRVESARSQVQDMETWLKDRSLIDLVALLDELDDEDYLFLKSGVDTNMKLADYGLTFGPGLGIGKALKRMVHLGLVGQDMVMAARILTSAAADARMSGVKLPAMSSAGSGNHGLTAILPLWAVKDYLNEVDERQVLRAVALSHIITAYIKAYTGRLTAICGCSVAAGAGATAGLTYLMGGNLQHIAGSIKNLVGDLAGVICDGAKAGCALKLSTAAGSAVQSALFSIHGIDVKATDGIVDSSPEQTMKNLGELSSQGMIEADRIILEIMVRKQFAEPACT